MSALEELLSRLDDGLSQATTRAEQIRWIAVRGLVEQLVTRPGPGDGPADAAGQRSTVRTG